MFKHVNIVIKPFVRYRNTQTKRLIKRKRTVNPGTDLQMRVLAQNQHTNLEEIDSLEADFTNLQISHKQHIEESRILKEREKYLIVREKYFKEKLPNFLTWNDKLQIRHLHNTDPEEWSVEKLSDGFPALPDVIKKIIKSSWTKTNQNKVKNHDLSVEKNWELLKENKLEIPVELKEHLKKFSSRKVQYPIQIEKKAISKIEGEFSEILKSYQRLKNEPTNNNLIKYNKTIIHNKPKKDTHFTPVNQDTKMVTLEELKNKIGEDVKMGKQLSVDEQLLIEENKIEKKSDNSLNSLVDLTQTNNTNCIKEVKKSDFKHLEYPEKIIIPKDKFKKGYTYKLNDCFYDSDGLFLYRVPGMED